MLTVGTAERYGNHIAVFWFSSNQHILNISTLTVVTAGLTNVRLG